MLKVDLLELAPQNLNVIADNARRMPKDQSYEQVSSYFTKSMAVASRQLRCSCSTLQVWCRMHMIPRWPYRKINSIDILLRNVEEYRMADFLKIQGPVVNREQLEEAKRSIEVDHSLPIPDIILCLRKHMDKKVWNKKRYVINKDN